MSSTHVPEIRYDLLVCAQILTGIHCLPVCVIAENYRDNRGRAGRVRSRGYSASFRNIARLVGRLRSGPRLVGRIGSGVRGSASFQNILRIVGRLGSGTRLVGRIGSGLRC